MNPLTEISSWRAKENTLGKSSDNRWPFHRSFQKVQLSPAATEQSEKPLKIGFNLKMSLHQKEPQGAAACGTFEV